MENKIQRFGISGISERAWDACCDGEWLGTLDYIPEGVNPWDGHHDCLAIRIEQEAEEESGK